MLFGAYVESISASAGYGADGGSCQMSLVFENDGPLRPYDLESNFPELGTAVGIKWGEFEFGGILQRFTHKRSLDGYRYDVILESPSKWLDGIQIILDGFQGTTFPPVGHTHPQENNFLPANKFSTELNYIFTNNINNVWNPFAVLENYQYGGNFGASDTNSAGFPAIRLLQLIEEISRGEHPFGGRAVFGESEYEVDLSELIPIVPEFFRVQGSPSQSLNSIIQECCEIATHDYIVFVEPKTGAMPNGVIRRPVIKVKVIDKRLPPDPDTIKKMVNQYEREQKLVSADFGKEFSDVVTQKMVIGAPATRHCMSSPYNFYPIWGKTSGIRPQYIIGNQTVASGGMDMFASVQVPLNSGAIYNATVLEVRCAMSSFETWILYKALMGDPEMAKFSKIRIDDYAIQGLISGRLTAQNLFNTKEDSKEVYQPYYQNQNPYEEIQKIYDAIKSCGDGFYGKKFLVPLPFEPGGIDNNIKFLSEDQSYITSWQISQSAWVDNKPFSDISFYDSDGKLKAVASWLVSNSFDYSDLGNRYAFGMGGLGTDSIEVETDIYWYVLGPIALPYCVVTVPGVLHFDEYTTDKLGASYLLKLIRNINIDPGLMLGFGADDGAGAYAISPARQAPMIISVPQESNRYNWGPWWKYSSKKGKAEVTSDPSLAPETFGSSFLLNSIGYDYAYVSDANVSGNESGYVEVAEVPAYNLSERFAVSGPYVSNMDISVGVDGVKTTYKFNSWTPQFGKLTKYNADRISRINKNHIKFLQDQRQKFFKPPLPQKTVMDILKSKFIPTLAGAPSLIMAVNLDLIDGKRPVAVAPCHHQQANIVGANPKIQPYGCTQEQIFTPCILQKPKDADPKSLNPYFSFEDTDFTHVVCKGNGVNSTDFQEHKDKVTEVRTIGLRGPILLSGWGYDISGNPVPAKQGSTTEFHENTATDRSLWKTGPIDLKWDDSRKMWVAGGLSIIEGILTTDIAAPDNPFDDSRSFTIEKYKKNSNGTWASDGSETIINRDPFLSLTLNANNTGKILVIAIKINNEWRPVWVSCPS
jgi:hypothetical protein